MQKNVKIAGIQIQNAEELKKTLSKTAELVSLAANEGARIITLPQLFNSRWFPAGIDAANFSIAEQEDGPTITFIKELAQKKDTVIIASIFERDGPAHFNAAFVIGNDGQTLGKYRKMHVPQIPLWEEKSYFKPGDIGFPVFKTPFATIGVQLCWDVFFPEGFRLLALQGAEIIFAPTASAFYHSREKWERAISAAAHANGIFIMRVNRVGTEEKQEFYGRSFCVRPDGEYAARPSGASEGVILAEVDLAEISMMRSEWTLLNDRRPEFYAGITEKK